MLKTKRGQVFGTAVPAKVPSGKRLIGPKDLPGKGIHYCASHLRRLWMDGKFPAPIYLSSRRFAWTEEAIDAWIDSKVGAA